MKPRRVRFVRYCLGAMLIAAVWAQSPRWAVPLMLTLIGVAVESIAYLLFDRPREAAQRLMDEMRGRGDALIEGIARVRD